jgi:hypothetical protein
LRVFLADYDATVGLVNSQQVADAAHREKAQPFANSLGPLTVPDSKCLGLETADYEISGKIFSRILLDMADIQRLRVCRVS